METSPDLTIACVYRPGGGFDDTYVHKLKQGVEQYVDAPFNFVCLSSKELPGIETIPLAYDLKGYWNKLELFRKDLFPGPVVYIDLDTIIVDDITEIVTHPHQFTAALNFKAKHGRSLASWFMGWDGRTDLSYLLHESHEGTPEEYSQDWARWGDQGFIQDHLYGEWDALQEMWPGCCASYKYDIRRPGFVPKGVKLVAFHGRPRPHQVNWNLPTNGNPNV